MVVNGRYVESMYFFTTSTYYSTNFTVFYSFLKELSKPKLVTFYKTFFIKKFVLLVRVFSFLKKKLVALPKMLCIPVSLKCYKIENKKIKWRCIFCSRDARNVAESFLN